MEELEKLIENDLIDKSFRGEIWHFHNKIIDLSKMNHPRVYFLGDLWSIMLESRDRSNSGIGMIFLLENDGVWNIHNNGGVDIYYMEELGKIHAQATEWIKKHVHNEKFK